MSAGQERLPHPASGGLFASPVPPGSGWPGDPAHVRTPVARSAGDVRRLAPGAIDVSALDALVSVCRACPRLVQWREDVARSARRASFAAQPYWGRPAPGFGDAGATVLVLGLAPAAHGANRTGRMFTGDRSGEWLYSALHRAGVANQAASEASGDGLTLDRVRITAAVHCAPPANRPTPQERDTCGHWLDRELELAAPTVHALLALGAFAWQAGLASARRIGWSVPRPLPRFRHAAETLLRTTSGREVAVVGCYHVSQQNTFTGRLTEPMLDMVVRRTLSFRAVEDETGPHDLSTE